MSTSIDQKKRTTAWLVSSVVCVAEFCAALCCGVSGYLLNWMAEADYQGYAAPIAKAIRAAANSYNTEEHMRLMIQLGIVFGVLAAAGLVVSVIFSGKKDEKGVRLAPLDRCFGEVQVFAGILAGCALYPAAILLTSAYVGSRKFITGGIYHDVVAALSRGDRTEYLTGFYEYRSISNLLSPWFAFVIAIIMILAIAAFELWVVQSIARKLKNHSFWENTIIGKVFAFCAGEFGRSTRLQLKVMAVLIVAVIVSGYWLGAVAVIGLILWQVPKLLRRFHDIQTATAQAASGDLDVSVPRNYSGDDLDRLSEDINAISGATRLAVEKELKNQKMKTDLITNVSHDLKTPLTSVVTYVDLLKKEGLDSENAPEYLEIIDQKANRLQHLTLDLFDAAKASSGDLPVELHSVDLVSMVNQAAGEFDDDLKKRDLELIINSPEKVQVMADGRYLWRVMENLLSNIRKYAMKGSRVYIDVSSDDEQGIVSVKNMSQERLNISADQLMERFTRGDESRTSEGSGLGLSIAKDLTSLMGGRLRITVDGDLFKAEVSLPLDNSRKAEPAETA